MFIQSLPKNKIKRKSIYLNAKRFFNNVILSIGLGIAMFVFALFASGIFFTGIVVQNTNSAIKDNVNKKP